jgi:hypothetical protein
MDPFQLDTTVQHPRGPLLHRIGHQQQLFETCCKLARGSDQRLGVGVEIKHFKRFARSVIVQKYVDDTVYRDREIVIMSPPLELNRAIGAGNYVRRSHRRPANLAVDHRDTLTRFEIDRSSSATSPSGRQLAQRPEARVHDVHHVEKFHVDNRAAICASKRVLNATARSTSQLRFGGARHSCK